MKMRFAFYSYHINALCAASQTFAKKPENLKYG